MEFYRFESVNLILAEPNWQMRENLKTRLFQEGFRNIVQSDRLDRLRRAVAQGQPDLVIADTHLPGGDMCELVYAIRHHLVGDNPFLPVIAITRHTHPDLVHKVIDCGADDLLAKPISARLLIERVNNLIRARKPFVVTSDYIGPDRRRTARDESTVPLIQVPNPLRAKVMGREEPGSTQAAINRAIVEINEQRIERHASWVGEIVTGVVAGYEAGYPAEVIRPDLERLLFMAEDIARRMAGTRYAHVSELCNSMIRVCGALLMAGDSPQDRDVKLLPEMARAVEGAFRLGERAAAVSHDISESVTRFASARD